MTDTEKRERFERGTFGPASDVRLVDGSEKIEPWTKPKRQPPAPRSIVLERRADRFLARDGYRGRKKRIRRR
jgi:hypothetical protein